MPTFDLKHGRFYHPPKRGGTWVTQACKAAGLVTAWVPPKHVGPHDAPVYPPKLGFTIVRHPLTWWRSVYRNRKGWWAKDSRDLAGRNLSYYPEIEECRANTYPEFMRNILARGIIDFWWDDRYRHPCVHYVLQQERLCDDLIDVLADLKEEFDPAVIQQTPWVGGKSFNGTYELPAKLRRAVMAACNQEALESFQYR